MPRPKTRPDAEVLDAAHRLIHQVGPEALTFASVAQACGLSASTLVQRFGSKAGMIQATLLHAWDGLDARTARLAAELPRTPEGAIALLVGLSGGYGGIEAYAQGLLVLREDLRDPALRARGAAWKAALSETLDACFAAVAHAPEGIGLLLATHWQGSLLWWGFAPEEPVERHVEQCLEQFIETILGPNGASDRGR